VLDVLDEPDVLDAGWPVTWSPAGLRTNQPPPKAVEPCPVACPEL
jgi:hypothetical protein